MSHFFMVLLVSLLASFASASTFRNLNELRFNLGFEKLSSSSSQRTVKVAVLDKGFRGYQREIGKSLPSNTTYIAGPLQAPAEANTEHGLRMAQILTGLYSEQTGRSEGLELYLYNVFGFTNFQTAITDLIDRRVDVVLYSEVWEFGGNLDGRGFINAEIDRALRKNVLWINAVGNFARTTYNGAIETTTEDRVILPNENYLLRVECQAPQGQTCPIRAVLSWNDFKDDANRGTDKDLDFELVNSLFDRIALSELRQVLRPLGDNPAPGTSNYPREIIVSEIKSGISYLKVKNHSKNFGRQDRLRITVDGENLIIPAGDRFENILVPADHAGVISVGAFDSDRSGVSLKLGKPDVMAPSSIVLADGNEFRGSSNSAAMTAAAAALLRRKHPGLSRAEFLASLRPASWQMGSISLRNFRFGTLGQACFQEGQWPQAPDHIRALLQQGGRLVETTQGWRIMMPFDPIELDSNLWRSRAADMVVAGPTGLQVYPRFAPVPSGVIEVFQRPIEAGLCHPPIQMEGRLLGF